MLDNYSNALNDGAQHPRKLSEIKNFFVEFVTKYSKIAEIGGDHEIDLHRTLFKKTFVKYCNIFVLSASNVVSFYQFANDLQRVMIEYYKDYTSVETLLELYDAYEDATF